MQKLEELREYLTNQKAEAERSAAAYHSLATQCRTLRAGLEQSLAEMTLRGDAELEIFLVGRIAEAAKAELENLRSARTYASEAAAHQARDDRLRG